MKKIVLLLFVCMLVVSCGCATGLGGDPVSKRTVQDAEAFLKYAPTLNGLIYFMECTPTFAANGSVYFVCANGNLWVRTKIDDNGDDRIAEWKIE